MRTLRLILGDQLNAGHSWFTNQNEDVLYLMAEMRQETDYARHHIQKVMAFFQSMRTFAAKLEEAGHRVRYYRISDSDNPQDLIRILQNSLKEAGASRLEYQLPDEVRLDQQLKQFASETDVEVAAVDSEHFYTSRYELTEFFKGKKQLVMESFYRMMRKKHAILMQGGQPEGGQWNFDKQNRKKWKGNPAIPDPLVFNKDLSSLEEEIRGSGAEFMGNVDATAFPWPTSREESLEVLDYFCDFLLPHFGDYQDAMHDEESFLFHSRLSFSLNSKMISPKEVVDRVEKVFREGEGQVHISQAEGFIRQILGWREYMRGIYWREMPGYAEKNSLQNHNALPEFYWTGKTKMKCLKSSIDQSLSKAYAHHIQRLMVTGNFALLIQAHPDEVDAWYLGVYIDAIEWVEITNTRGMSQFADGGLLATKPYISSANYIGKMSNYCGKCPYDPKKRTGESACPFNSLYWNFLDAKREHLSGNPRMGMMYRLLDKINPEEMQKVRLRAQEIIERPDDF